MIIQNTRQFRLMLFLSVILFPASLDAQQIVPARDGTGTIVTPQDHRFDITGGQLSGDRTNLFHSFERLGLSEGQILNFLSSPEIQNILGRVTGGEASFIDGLIQITGGNSNLFLMNPAGIVFGQNASLNVPAAFTATTATGIVFDSGNWFHAIQNNTWSNLVGDPNQFLFETQNPGSVVNFGNLEVAPGESLTLLAGTVLNTGTLTAPGGRITVASIPGAGRVRMSQIGYLLSLELLPLEGIQDTFNPLSLPELLTGGNIKVATTVQVTEAGEIILTESRQTVPSQTGTTVILGSLNAVGTSETSLEDLGKGGEINLIGDRLFIANAEINASGLNGGGTIRIGGDYKGLGLLPNASQTLIDQTTSIQANGLQNGDGGRVIIWSEEYTQVDGKISVQGGLNTGNGGFVETSSRGELAVTQAPDLSAPNGVGGTWLIDPLNITIVEEDVPDQPGLTFIAVDEIEAGLATGNVILETGTDPNIPGIGDITFDASINFDNPSEGPDQTTLTFNAANNINFQNQSIVNNVPEIASLNIDFNADIDADGRGVVNINNSTIDTGGGNFTASGSGIIITQNSLITTGAGSITLEITPGIDAAIGIEIRDSQIISTDGNIDLTGISNSGDGISVRDSQIETGIGNISLSGVSGTNEGSDGIRLEGSTIQSVEGDIEFIGTGNGIARGQGVIIGDSSVESTGNGSIAVTGVNTGSGERNRGTVIQGNSIVSTEAGNGAIRLAGTGGTGDGSVGFAVFGDDPLVAASTIRSGTGAVEITGTTNNDVNSPSIFFGETARLESNGGAFNLSGDREIRVRSLSTNGGAVNITSSAGSIDASSSLLDTSSATGNGGSVTLQAFETLTVGEIRTQTSQPLTNAVGGTVTFNAGNRITLTEDLDLSVDGGTSGNLIFNGNLRLDQPVRTLTTTGNILFNGLVNGSSPDVGTHDLVLNAGTGEIEFNQAVGSITSLGDLTINSSGTTTFNSTVNAASLLTNAGGTTQLTQDVTTSGPSGQQYGDSVNLLGSITLTADEINFADTVSGTGQELTVQPFTANQTILLGGDSNSNPNVLEITQTELNLISPDLNLLIIGTEQLSNTIDWFGDTTFRTPVVLQAQSFNVSDFTLTGTDNATITLTAAEDLTTGDITNPGRDIRLTSLNGPIDTRSGTLDTSSPEADGGNVFLDAAGEIFVGAVNTSTQSLSSTDQAGTLNFTGTDVTLAGNLDLSATTGQGNSVNFTVPVQIDNEITINTAGAADSGNITFDNFINSSDNSGQDGPSLTLDAGTGTVSLSSVGAIAPLFSLQVQTAGTTTLTGDITVTDTIDFSAATGGTALNPEFSDALTLTTQNTGNIFFDNSPITGTNTRLTLTTGTVALDQVGAEGAELAGITLQVGIANLFGNLFSGDGLDFSPVSQVNILGDRVILSTASTNGAILIPSDVEGPGLLTLKAGSGDITLGAVGNDVPLAGLEIDGGNVTGEGSITVGVGGVVIEATGEVNLNRSLVTEGSVNLSALQNLTTANITAADIILDTQQNLTTGNLSTASPNPTIEEPEAGGFVVLKALVGEITTGSINSTGTTGGNITLQALTAIRSGQINASGSLGDGGNVLLDPTGDVEVGWIRAEGGAEGTGGAVEIISTGGFFRATETFPTPFSPDEPASISTASPNGGGTIIIRHAGGEQGSPIAPFAVGDPTENGTEGILTTGEFATEVPSSWPQSATLGNIIFQTDDSLTPTPPTFPPTPPTLPPTPPTLPPTPPTLPPTPPTLPPTPPTLPPTPPTLPPTPPTPPQRPSNSKEPQGSSAIAIERDSLGRDLEEDELDLKTADLTTPLTSEDYAFQMDDLDKTLWLLEHSLNQEFENHLGLESAPVRDRRAIQQVLKKVEAETGEVYVIVYLVARDEQLEVVLVTSSGSPIHRSVPEARAELLFPVIKALQGSITTPREQNTNRYQDSAKQLYDWILQPIEADLQNAGATTLLFSLGLGLRSLPIAALWDGEQFLIEKYNYSLIPSTSLISTTYTPLTAAAILAMGASQFSDQAPLPAVPLEVEKITELWPGQVFLNESFTLSNLQVQRRLINYEVIHLATHADFQPGTPENSYIQLWDQKLPLSQLPDLNWDTPQLELLVLSACQTAIGDREAELGFAGLAVQAGAKSAIASLWNVSDEGTLGLMSEFYIELKTAPIKAAALRQAQIDMIQGKVRIESGQLITERGVLALPPELVEVNSQSLAHPYYWAGFTLIGTPW